MKRFAPAAERNKEPILGVLREALPSAGLVLEIASGTGQHAVHFARALAPLVWQPSEIDPELLASIAAHAAEAELENLRPPLRLDVRVAEWGLAEVDAMFCANMIHIAPWTCAEGLMAGAARTLAPGAPLVLYGPFRFDGVFTAPSNAEFDASLRARDPAWGVRDESDVRALAERHGLDEERIVGLPANNHALVFRRR